MGVSSATASADCRRSKGSKPPKRMFKANPIGYLHIDIAKLQIGERKPYIYVTIDGTSKFAFVNGIRQTGRTFSSWPSLEALIAGGP